MTRRCQTHEILYLLGKQHTNVIVMELPITNLIVLICFSFSSFIIICIITIIVISSIAVITNSTISLFLTAIS